jgi:hypothetical protein
MATYLDSYGAGDEKRFRKIKRIVIAVVAIIVVSVTIYLLVKNLPEKQVIKTFLKQVNSGQYQAAYTTWGCTSAHPCSEYPYQKFLEDWGPKQGRNNWGISDVDGCPTGVIITVRAPGSDSEPLWVQRNDKSISFSPWPECQGKRWRFRQFFHRILGS